MAQEKYVAYVGTYTHENSVGIHIYDVDVTKGYMTERKVVPINNPSDLVVSKNAEYARSRQTRRTLLSENLPLSFYYAG